MSSGDLIKSIEFAAIPVIAFGALLLAGVATDLWAEGVAVHKATRGRPWLLFRRRVKRRVSEAQRN